MLTAAKLVLAPLLLLQGRRVRRAALLLPEAKGPRRGTLGSGPKTLRLIIVGDSATAGVGAARQSEALAGRLVRSLSNRLGGGEHRLHWHLLARIGATTEDAIAMLDEAWSASGHSLRADVAVIGIGVNDVTGQVPVGRWLHSMDVLAQRLSQRHGVRLIVVSGLPPMHRFPLLPQPLRWYLGSLARGYDRALQAWARRRPDTVHAPIPAMTDRAAMAEDGFHPGPLAYGVWGDALAAAITDRSRECS